MKWHYIPPFVKVIKPKWGACALCGASKNRVVYLKDIKKIVCPEHREAYAVISEYDDGFYKSQTISDICPTREEAETKARERNKIEMEMRIAVGWRPVSYTIMSLQDLLNARYEEGDIEEGA